MRGAGQQISQRTEPAAHQRRCGGHRQTFVGQVQVVQPEQGGSRRDVKRQAAQQTGGSYGGEALASEIRTAWPPPMAMTERTPNMNLLPGVSVANRINAPARSNAKPAST